MREIWLVQHVSNYLHRTPGAVRNLVLRRRIPFRKAGGRLIFFRDEIESWADASPGVKLNEVVKE